MKILVLAERLSVRSDDGATKATIEFIRILEGEKTLIGMFEGNFELDGIRVIRLPAAKIKIIEYLIFTIATIYYTARMKTDRVYYFPSCFPNKFPAILHQLHGYILSKIAKEFMEVLYQTGRPTFVFRVLSRFRISVTSKESSKEFEKYGLRVSFLPVLYPKVQRDYNKEELRKRYGLKKDDFVVLHVGHLQEGRGLDVLSDLPELMPGIKIIIVLSSMKTKIKTDLKGSKTIYFIDRYIEDIYEIYSIADVYVFPIKVKGAAIDIPLSILEAKEMSLPIIASNLSNLREALTGYPKAYFLEINSSKEMAKNIQGYIKQIRASRNE